MTKLLLAALAAVIAVLNGWPSTTHAIESVRVNSNNSLDAAMRDSAQEILDLCRAKGFRNVGVLKFMVVKSNRGGTISEGALKTTIGTIHHSLARKLEIGMLLANDERDPMGIIDDASATAETLSGASYLRADQRPRILSAKYPLHWGVRRVSPDAMITGLVQLDSDLRTASISFLLFAKRQSELTEVGVERQVRVDASWLPEIGESFSLTRGAFDSGDPKTSAVDNDPSNLPDDPASEVKNEQASDSAARVRDEQTTHPLNDPSSPIRVEIRYDGKTMNPTFTNGVAGIAEPHAGQAIRIDIIKDSSKNKYGICVKVNGESTLERSTQPDHACRKWILSRPNQRLTLRGYQVSESEIEAFRVLAADSSKLRELNYGKDVGTIAVTVFPEQLGEPQVKEADKELDLIASTKLPDKKLGTFGLLKAKLLGQANRGLIVEGSRTGNRINRLKFSTSKSPVMTATIHYYQTEKSSR